MITKYFAKDPDGVVFMFRHKPQRFENCWYDEAAPQDYVAESANTFPTPKDSKMLTNMNTTNAYAGEIDAKNYLVKLEKI